MKIKVFTEDEKLNQRINNTIKKFRKKEQIFVEVSRKPHFYSSSEEYKGLNKETDVLVIDISSNEKEIVKAAFNLRDKGYSNEIVFLSDKKDLVFDSFSAEPINFILTDSDLEEKLSRTFLKSEEKKKEKRREMLSFCFGGETRNIYVDTILYFESLNRLIDMRYGKNESFKFYTPLRKVEEVFEKKGFIRIHKSFIVSIEKVKKVNRKTVTMQDGVELPVGAAYRKNLDLIKG